jgi:hypothetical protein
MLISLIVINRSTHTAVVEYSENFDFGSMGFLMGKTIMSLAIYLAWRWLASILASERYWLAASSVRYLYEIPPKRTGPNLVDAFNGLMGLEWAR